MIVSQNGRLSPESANNHMHQTGDSHDDASTAALNALATRRKSSNSLAPSREASPVSVNSTRRPSAPPRRMSRASHSGGDSSPDSGGRSRHGSMTNSGSIKGFLKTLSVSNHTDSTRTSVYDKNVTNYGSGLSDHGYESNTSERSHRSRISAMSGRHSARADGLPDMRTLPALSSRTMGSAKHASVKKPLRKTKSVKKQQKTIFTWSKLCCCKKRGSKKSVTTAAPSGAPYYEGANSRV